MWQMAYQYKREPLSDEEVNKFTNAAQSFQEKLTAFTLLDIGLRVGEYAALTKDNLQWQERRLVIYGKGYGKKSKRRVIPMTERVRVLLERHFAVEDTPGISKRTAQREVIWIANCAGITKPCTAPVLRHTFAVTCLRRDMSIVTAKELLGMTESRPRCRGSRGASSYEALCRNFTFMSMSLDRTPMVRETQDYAIPECRGKTYPATTFLVMAVIALHLRIAGALTAAQDQAPSSHRAPGQPVTITSIKMFDETTGWASASSLLLRTTDGGHTWRDVTPPDPLATSGEPLWFFLDGQRGWVIYDLPLESFAPKPSIVWRTQDAGRSWAPSSSLNAGENPFKPGYLSFGDAQNGWLMCPAEGAAGHMYGVLFRTTDGGTNWEFQPYSMPSATSSAMVFADAHTGVVTLGFSAFSVPVVYWTFDGGDTWQQKSLPPPADESDLFERGYVGTDSPVFFSAQSLGALVNVKLRLDNAMKTFFYLTRDRGATWQIAPIGETHDEVSLSSPWVLQFVTPEVGWALGRDIYQTRDSGKTWQYFRRVYWNGQFSFINEKMGWAAVRSREGTAFVQTANGGRTWTMLHPTLVP